MDFISAKEAADKWEISQRRVATLCAENRIISAQRVGNMWLIPINAEKPLDARRSESQEHTNNTAKPFLKWAGGKSQLIEAINKYYPFSNSITKYAEPFVGGGAILFDILNNHNLKQVYISDVNVDLINTYIYVRDNLEDLLELLNEYQNKYLSLKTEERKKFYILQRELFNKKESHSKIEHAGLLIFLNKTCFNGLYRVNKKGAFNVPMGAYKNPLICNEKNLRLVSKQLQKVEIVCGDYKKSLDFIDNQTFVYLDPPYRPLTQTSNFTSYTENEFTDANQIELAEFIKEIDKKGAKFVLSNSDPKNINEHDNFFDELYKKYKISRVEATRMINSKSEARGKIKELLITNY